MRVNDEEFLQSMGTSEIDGVTGFAAEIETVCINGQLASVGVTTTE